MLYRFISYFEMKHLYNQSNKDGLHGDNVQENAFRGLWRVPFLGLGTLGSGWQRQMSLGDSACQDLEMDGRRRASLLDS